MNAKPLHTVPAALALGLLLLLCAATAALAATNHRPAARPDAFTSTEDQLLSVSRTGGVLKNDYDRDRDRLFVKLTRATDHGTISLGRDGSFVYDSADDYNGTDSFAYKACEVKRPRVCSYAVGVTITVSPENDAPQAADDFLRAKQNRIKVLSAPGVLANDTDPDGEALHVAGYSQARHGRVLVGAGGSVKFVPDKNFYGKTFFRYWAADEAGAKDEAIVYVRVRR
jgi:VCBS repeat-containing protein